MAVLTVLHAVFGFDRIFFFGFLVFGDFFSTILRQTRAR